MNSRPRRTRLPWRWVAVAVAVAGASLPAAVRAQDDPGWQGQAQIGYATTAGNSETETLSLRVRVGVESEIGRIGIEAGGLQTTSTSVRRFAERSEVGELVLVEEPTTSLSAERYWARFHFRHLFGPWRTFWFGRVEWDRNEPAGIRNRFTGLAGLGNDWIHRDSMRFWTEYGWTFNRERRRVEGLPRATNYPGLRFEWEYWWEFSGRTEYRTTQYTNHLRIDQNLDDRADVRAVMEQELEIGISERLSVVLRLEHYYDDDPAFRAVPVLEDGRRTGELLRVPLDKLDTYFTTSLAVQF